MYMGIRHLKFTLGVDFLYLSIYMVVQKSTAEGNTKSFHAFFIAFQDQGESQNRKAMEREKRYPTEGFHLGNLIKAELTRQGRSITWLASQVDCSRENLYKVFHHKWIYTDLLFQICEALDYDFFKLCSDYYQAKKREQKDQ